MSKGIKHLKEMFDKIDKEEGSEEDYNENEGENLVVRGNKDKIKKNISNFDKVQKDLKKYEGKTTSYSKIKQIQEGDNEESEDQEIEDPNEDDEINSNHQEEDQEEKEDHNDEEQSEDNEEQKTNDASGNNYTKDEMDKEDEKYLKTLTRTTPNEVKKAKNVSNQKSIFDFLIGLRISLQPLLTSINSLPPYQSLDKFLSSSEEQIQKDYIHIQSSLSGMLKSILTAHKKLLMKSNIPSSESFDSITIINSIINSIENDSDESIEQLLSFHDTLGKISEKIVDIWYKKSIVYSNKSNNNLLKISNGSFCENIVRNIEDKFGDYRKNTEKTNNEKLLGRKRESEDDYQYDEEIYNDIDFYNKLLREFLLNNENEIDTTYSNDNRMDLTLKAIINKQAKTKKNNVDTKASKNRKIRYDKHEKIINFMVPEININEAVGRDIIVKSMFGTKKKINENTEENDVDLI